MEDLIKFFFNKIEIDKHSTCPDRFGDGDCIKCSQEIYRNGNDISYSCDNFRYIYVTRYLPVHTKEIRSALNSIGYKYYDHLKSKRQLTICSIGGGPGTDIYAFNTWINFHINELNLKSLNCYRVEECMDWNNIAGKIVYNNKLDGDDISSRYFRKNVDVCNKKNTNIPVADLYILSYIVSELNNEEIDNLVYNLECSVKKNSIFIINDRDQDEVNKSILDLLDKLNVNHNGKHCNSDWCGFVYDEKIKEAVSPKLKLSSIYYCGMLQ